MPLFGHAIEARISCEDPANDFLPQVGTISCLRERSQATNNEVSDVRIETGVREGDTITSFYDPMISKVIAHGETREEAI
jgi:3-methylcrotonyl-CoA carboxylase alpha subunit